MGGNSYILVYQTDAYTYFIGFSICKKKIKKKLTNLVEKQSFIVYLPNYLRNL